MSEEGWTRRLARRVLVITGYGGHHTLFVMVGKLTKESPWHMVSIGSGP